MAFPSSRAKLSNTDVEDKKITRQNVINIGVLDARVARLVQKIRICICSPELFLCFLLSVFILEVDSQRRCALDE